MQDPTFNDKTDKPSPEKTRCMIDCKKKVWENVKNAAFLVFCMCYSTVYKEKDLSIICGKNTGW